MHSLGAGAYSGYRLRYSSAADDELTRVGPGTPCGEYLSRYWHPVFVEGELRDRPVLLRLLGEDLVLFRDGDGRIGLVHKHCPHRRASLEYGSCRERGIRCCYHGWRFDIDGSLLDVPGQGEGLAARLKQRIRLGAYPVMAFKGLIFAYLGPPESLPEFPVYDTLELPAMTMVPYRAPFACNWLQVLDAIMDPIHTCFLHSSISREQFSGEFGVVVQMDFFERDAWLLGCHTRRVGSNVWLRTNELVLPNFTQAGAAFATDGTRQRYYGRSAFSRWVVPVDDENTVCYAWANFGDRGDPPEWNTSEGPELIEQGEVFDRSYEKKQRYPADVEAVEGMGSVTVHDEENLVISDKGVALMRRRIREQIRQVSSGGDPTRVTDLKSCPVPTYGGDTVLRIPRVGSGEEARRLSEIAHEFMDVQFGADGLPEMRRVEFVTERLKSMESLGAAVQEVE